MVIFYLAAAACLAHQDGIRGVDIPYFISAMVTTVGLGDVSPSGQVHRGATVVMLPFGLVVISLGISLVKAHAKSINFDVVPDAPQFSTNKHLGVYEALRTRAEKHWSRFRGSPVQIILFEALKYATVVLIGACFFLVASRERRLQVQNFYAAPWLVTVERAVY